MGLTQVSTDGVKNDAITKTKIPANQIEASELADNAVDTNAIVANAVTGDKIASNSISTAKIQNSAVDATSLQINSVTTAKIVDGNVTKAKIENLINNNADNRLITGSGTANTLEGESDLTFSSNTLDVNNAVKLPDAGTVHFGVSDTAYVRGKDSTDGYLKLGTAGLDRVIVNPSGNVGINTTSPQCGLDYKGSEFRLENASVPFIRLKSTNAQGSNNGDYGRILNDVAGNVTGLLDWKRQGATDDSYFTIFNKQSATTLQERLRITSKGALFVHAGQQTNLSNMNKDSLSMPKFFENNTNQDSGLVGADIHFQTIVRGTSGTNDTLFTFSGGGNCGFFCEITAY